MPIVHVIGVDGTDTRCKCGSGVSGIMHAARGEVVLGRQMQGEEYGVPTFLEDEDR